MIRQAISCDICAREMQNSNHWFVVYDRGAELRVIRWGASPRRRAGVRHLCGQTCLHKLVDEFMARPTSQALADLQQATMAPSSAVVAADVESSARLIVAPEPVAEPAPQPDTIAAPPLTLVTRPSHAEAWKREREREQHRAGSRRSIA